MPIAPRRGSNPVTSMGGTDHRRTSTRQPETILAKKVKISETAVWIYSRGRGEPPPPACAEAPARRRPLGLTGGGLVRGEGWRPCSPGRARRERSFN